MFSLPSLLKHTPSAGLSRVPMRSGAMIIYGLGTVFMRHLILFQENRPNITSRIKTLENSVELRY